MRQNASFQPTGNGVPRYPRMISTVIRYRQDRALGDLVINQTKKPQPFLVPIARCAGGESQLASLDGVSLIMGTLYYSAEHSHKGLPAPARQRR